MRRSPADSTNRSLAAFGKLQHIRPKKPGRSVPLDFVIRRQYRPVLNHRLLDCCAR